MRDALIRRLSTYWKLEALNIALVPLIAFVIVYAVHGTVTSCLLISMFACSFLLGVGTIAWRVELFRLQGDSAYGRRWVPILAKLKIPSLAFCVIAVIAIVWESRSKISLVTLFTAIGLAVLALLEYVNYYHVQLQHFDHWADFKRLISGRGFRTSHLAKAIAEWKSQRTLS